MSQLILIDKESGLEVGRRDMAPQERYQLYHDCSEHERLTYDAKEYTLHTVAWQVPDENCVVSVTYHARERLACGCARGYCGCC
jgi:hypothetical protein